MALERIEISGLQLQLPVLSGLSKIDEILIHSSLPVFNCGAYDVYMRSAGRIISNAA